MRTVTIASLIAILYCASPALPQEPAPKRGPQPIYHVTVIERNIDAVNYLYRAGATNIDFRGTVLLPSAKGSAAVSANRGSTVIEAKFEDVPAPTRFGREYLTYVLWAISPDGSPHNLGEIIPDSSNDAKLHATSNLEAFGMIVTAEPYSAVRQPSDVVVLENRVRKDTKGAIQAIQAKYELLPRGQYTLPDNAAAQPAKQPKVSMSRYEAILELYQAQNAVGIAQAAGADRLASSTLEQAQQLLSEAQRAMANKSSDEVIVQNARAAALKAEDARAIAARRSQEEKLSEARTATAAAREAQAQAEADAQRARAEASAARAQANADRAAREGPAAAPAQATVPGTQSSPRAQIIAPAAEAQRTEARKRETRVQLVERFNGVLTARDTPRGIVLTLPGDSFDGGSLRSTESSRLSRIAQMIAAEPGLRVEVEGYSDGPSGDEQAKQRADAVRNALVAGGLPAGDVSARGLGDSRPLASNATDGGRRENDRVEVVISGELLGSMPSWDRTYSLAPEGR